MIAAVNSAYWTVSRPSASAVGDGEDDDDDEVAGAEGLGDRGGDDQAEHGADRPQDQPQVRFVAVGAHHEEDRQRDPEAVVVHVEGAVDGDADRERGAEADRVAEVFRAAG